MIEKRWKLAGCVAALFVGLLSVRPAVAADCGVAWGGAWRTADVNGDAAVDGLDLGVLLGAWGDCEGCATDFDHDDKVGCVDEALLLGNWGRCSPPQMDLDGQPGVSCIDLSLLLDSVTACTKATGWGQIGYQGFPLYDVDSSGSVDEHDANLIECLLGTPWPPGTLPPFDVNLDWIVDAKDLQLVTEAAGASCYDPNQDGLLSWPDIYVLIERWPP